MSRNIEIKYRCSDLKKTEERLKSLGARFSGEMHQIDTFFNTPSGRIKLRQSGDEATLIIYQRQDQARVRASDYVLLPVAEAAQTRELLSNTLGVRGTVEKTRRLYFYQNVRIHLDQVKGLGNFIEMEAVVKEPNQQKQAFQTLQFLSDHLELAAAWIIPQAYMDLLERPENVA